LHAGTAKIKQLTNGALSKIWIILQGAHDAEASSLGYRH
jgi:hypothetical protein